MTQTAASGWSVWRAFDHDRERCDGALWKALAEACRGADGKIDRDLFDHWCEGLVWYRWGA